MLHVNGVFVCCVVEVEDVGDREGFDQGATEWRESVPVGDEKRDQTGQPSELFCS
jgi:hypothetical protein